MRIARLSLVAALWVALLAPALAGADPVDRREHAHEHYDVRHGHNHYYPERGLVVRVVPHEARVVVWGRERLWFHDGVWYRAHGRRFVVIAPPLGVVVPALPPLATVVVIGGIEYYYSNEAYYRFRAEQGDYEVVAPPEGQAGPAPAPPPGTGAPPPSPPISDNVFVYPKNGQSAEQQARDRYECHRWAADQTGFDPTRPAGGVPPEAARAKRGDYLRAQQACLEARGYTVR